MQNNEFNVLGVMGIDPNAGFMDKGGIAEGLIKTLTPLGKIEAGVNLIQSIFDPSVRDQSLVGRGVGAVLGDKPLIGNNGVINTNNIGFGGGWNPFGDSVGISPTAMALTEVNEYRGYDSPTGFDVGSYSDEGSYGYGTVDGIGVEDPDY